MVHGWAYSHSHLCGCCRPASGHTVRGVRQSGPAINQERPSSNPELGEYEGSVGTYPRVLHGSFSCFPGFSLVLDPRSRLGGLGRKVGCACEEFDICEGGI